MWTCELKKLQYHNGKDISARDYINTINTIKKLKEESLEVLNNIKNVSSKSYEIKFILKKPNKNFLHLLANMNLTPREEEKTYPLKDQQSFSGPFFVASLNESKVILKPNKHYSPPVNEIQVEGVFVDEATTSLNLFETNRLDFLRYLETSYFPQYKNALLSPNLKLDGLFFNPKLSLSLRKNSHSH